MKPEIQHLGSVAAAIASRKRALEKYYLNPQLCRHCNSVIVVKDHERVRNVRRKVFCSMSCSGSYNGAVYPKRKPEGQCDNCGTTIPRHLKYCGRKCKGQAIFQRNKGKVTVSASGAVVKWRQRTKLRAIEYKGGKCQRCGYDRCINAMDFHHVDPSQKEIRIGGSTRSWAKLKTELDKCVLLCANCHREFHAGLWKIEEIVPRSFNGLGRLTLDQQIGVQIPDGVPKFFGGWQSGLLRSPLERVFRRFESGSPCHAGVM